VRPHDGVGIAVLLGLVYSSEGRRPHRPPAARPLPSKPTLQLLLQTTVVAVVELELASIHLRGQPLP
jgi:hypothetical protein